MKNQIGRRLLADALRELNTEAVTCTADETTFAEVAKVVKGLCEKLNHTPRRERLIRSRSVEEEINSEEDHFHYGELVDFSPVAGLSNPMAPPMRIFREGDNVVGRINFSRVYEGAPGIVHGGYIAAAFDDLLGVTQSLSGKAGWTGTLTVKYRSPCPVITELRMVGRIESIKGRKIFAKADLFAGERRVADAEAIFITI